jgi:hypothetical protein
VQPGSEPGSLGDGRRQASALRSACSPGHLPGKLQVGGDWLGEAAGRRALLELAVAERGGHQQLVIRHGRLRDRGGRQDAE